VTGEGVSSGASVGVTGRGVFVGVNVGAAVDVGARGAARGTDGTAISVGLGMAVTTGDEVGVAV